MYQLRELCDTYFSFLYQLGYMLSDDNGSDTVIFQGMSNQIEIVFSKAEYEITCMFLDNSNQCFSLQEGLNYAEISQFRGLFQIADLTELEKGIAYLAEVVKVLYEEIDVSVECNFQKIYDSSRKVQKAELETYYLKTDLRKAENYWKQKEYAKARELFEKHLDQLSQRQLKQLEYIGKNRKMDLGG